MTSSTKHASRVLKPIIIMGAARSGTHLLSRAFENHPDVAYLSEPNIIWRSYNARLRHDMIPASLATEKVKSHIHSKFEQLRQGANKPRVCDKTPSNCLRVPFVLEVFPDAKIIHIVRDGREVVASSIHKFKGNVQKVTDRSKSGQSTPEYGSLKNLKLVLWRARHRLNQGVLLADIPYHIPKIVGTTTGLLGLRKNFSWGPEFPGMNSMLKTHLLADVCALQWKLSVEGVLNAAVARKDMHYIQIKFEDLVSDYGAVTRRLYEFTELEQPNKIVGPKMRTIDNPKSNFNSELSQQEREVVMDRIADTLSRLNYT